MSTHIKTNYNLNDETTVSVIDELSLWAAPFGLKLLEKINYTKNISVLDLGSGLGFPLLEIAMRLGNTCKVYGIDPWDMAIERIKTKIKIYGTSNVELFCGVAEKIPLPDSSVDMIVSNNGLNNVNDLSIALSECSRIAKTGAQFVFTYNTEKTMIEFYSVLEEILSEWNLYHVIDQMKEHIYIKRKPLDEYLALLERNGFRVNEIVNDEFSYRFVDAQSMFNHFLIKLAFLGSWLNFIPEERQGEILAEAETLLNRKKPEKGSLVLTVPFVLINCTKV
jgi:ubiquinone/menaquinone biosynthesis C-methylase UbiE